jgi:hypothetical protein
VLGTACAQSAAQVAWTCAISADGTCLDCASSSRPGAVASSAAAGGAAAAVVRGVAFPLDPTGTYSVALWSPPTERRFVELLASATICFRTPDCRVAVGESDWIDRRPETHARMTAGKAHGAQPGDE